MAAGTTAWAAGIRRGRDGHICPLGTFLLLEAPREPTVSEPSLPSFRPYSSSDCDHP